MKSTLGIKHNWRNSPEEWLDEKRKHDGAEGLWRIHNGLYDLSDFISRHPGGKFWLQATEGMDVTEAFESHHISLKPDKLLPKYFVRKATTPRNSPFTFLEDGFYRTFKRKVRKVLVNVPVESAMKTNVMVDGMFAGAILVGVLAAIHGTFILAIVAGLILGVCTVAAHSYYHRKDNFRMYYNDIALLPSRSWRIIHVLSHHGYTNSVADLQSYGFDPFVQVYPCQKSTIYKALSILTPLTWPTFIPLIYFSRFNNWKTFVKNFTTVDLLPLVLPILFCVVSKQSVSTKLLIWAVMIAVSSFWFMMVGLVTNHINPDIFVDGDKPRSPHKVDWGTYQLDAVGDKTGVVNTHFLGLISFGDHGLHHLLPTLDHGAFQHLYPVFWETLKEFNLFLRVMRKRDMWVGYFDQLRRETPNPNPPNLATYGVNL
ncbi:hypothetical protein PPYR_12699 [Photinus pyralis]|uniref:Cytochrome b5-related protein n=2 Tax=Photinus pyralis TaxID=7054 RepID=A0A5N4A731_PHOPY|nr:cytochrome b5-related protein-like [Photinus pyralis]KAB0793079.1 hypothetical protein PPYR_12699 [Photinus pyralis]